MPWIHFLDWISNLKGKAGELVSWLWVCYNCKFWGPVTYSESAGQIFGLLHIMWLYINVNEIMNKVKIDCKTMLHSSDSYYESKHQLATWKGTQESPPLTIIIMKFICRFLFPRKHEIHTQNLKTVKHNIPVSLTKIIWEVANGNFYSQWSAIIWS